VRNEAIRQLDHTSGTPVVSRELNDPHLEIILQLTKSLRTRTVPLVDDLVIISDHEQVAWIITEEKPQDSILSVVCVLELIDAYVPIDSSKLLGDRRPRAQELAR